MTILVRTAEIILSNHFLKSSGANVLYRSFATKKVLHDLLINMPKEPVHLDKLKAARKQKKENAPKYPAGFINLQVIGNGSKGAPTSLYVFTDQTRYLFNCGEGTQRLAHEHKVKLSKLEHIFITSKLWNRIGGLPGLMLTVQDIGIPSITIHGPPEMDQLFEGTKRFVILKDLQVRISDSSIAEFYEDHVMRIDYVPLFTTIESNDSNHEIDDGSSAGSPLEEDIIDYYAKTKDRKRPLRIIREDSDEKRSKTTTSNAVCYICRPKEKPGCLMLEKCLEFGVPSGPLLGKLKAGEDVTLANGKVVKAEDVTTPRYPGPVFIIIDCPNTKYLDSLVESDSFDQYQSTDGNEKDFARVIVHFSPKQVMEQPKYVEWMKRFHSSTQHLLLNDLNDGNGGSEAVHRAQYRLNQLDKCVFPLLGETGMPVKDESVNSRRITSSEFFEVPVFKGNTLLKFNLRPTIGIDSTSGVMLDAKLYIQEAKENQNFCVELQKFKVHMNSLNIQQQEFPEVIFLGTGSCIPNKTRNTSAILVQLSSDSYILLDCGEGTFGQLSRFFSPTKISEVLTKLKAVYISHLHADHHLGLVNIIMQRHQAFERSGIPFQPLTLIAPYQILSWLNLFDKCFERIESLYELVPNSSLQILGSTTNDESETQKVLDRLGLAKFDTVLVRHCPNAYGVAMTGTGNPGWKITYSGDTMPSDYLVTIGQDSDLLIHEATMEDELHEEAVHKMHSTVSEAIGIGKKMNAKFTMLTHFSQRYAKVPKVDVLDNNVGIAFDNMCVRLTDLPKIPLMYPALKSLFAEHYEEMELKTAKKIRRKEKLLEQVTEQENARKSRVHV